MLAGIEPTIRRTPRLMRRSPAGLPTMLDLPVPAALRRRVDGRLLDLEPEGRHHPLIRDELRAWSKENERLVGEACDVTNPSLDALAQLCRRDPRYPSTDLVVYAVLDAKLTIVYPDTHFPTTARTVPMSGIETRREVMRQQHVRERIDEAKRF